MILKGILFVLTLIYGIHEDMESCTAGTEPEKLRIYPLFEVVQTTLKNNFICICINEVFALLLQDMVNIPHNIITTILVVV